MIKFYVDLAPPGLPAARPTLKNEKKFYGVSIPYLPYDSLNEYLRNFSQQDEVEVKFQFFLP